jgi:protein arginine N-methyltransferase 1
VKKEELDFKSAFSLKCDRDDYCHAIVAYFNVEFSKTHTKHRFSTGPRSDYTHWKQTVFYLEEPIPCSKDQTISGNINVARNAKNPRDIDITISTQLDGPTPKYQATKAYRLR